VIYLTAYADDDTLKKAKITEPYGYIVKPFALRELRSSIEMAIYKHDAEKIIKDREHLFSSVFKSIGDAVITVDETGVITFLNHAAEEFTGWRHDDAVGKVLEELFIIVDEITGEPLADTVKQALKEGRLVSFVDHSMIIFLDKRQRSVDVGFAPIKNGGKNAAGVVIILHDSTDRRKAEEQINSSLKEKEALLKEIHYRVNNNLQTITAMLGLQSSDIHDEEIINALRESRSRVKAIALIHENLYRSKDATHIDFKSYVKELLLHLFSSYSIEPDMIKQEMEIEDVLLGVDAAIPCAMILNEFISKTLSHVLPDQKGDKVGGKNLFISLHKRKKISLIQDMGEGSEYELIARAGGIRLPESLDFCKTVPPDSSLIGMLVDQLKGTIDIHRDGVVECKVVFPCMT
jgi:PAS domain S-box-containing protein